MNGKGKHALIFGASGISGWSLMNQCLSYPSPSTFHRITGLCNRHIEKEALLLPNDSRLNIVSGIDLRGSVEIVMEQLKTKVEDIISVDIVFFCGKPTKIPSFYAYVDRKQVKWVPLDSLYPSLRLRVTAKDQHGPAPYSNPGHQRRGAEP